MCCAGHGNGSRLTHLCVVLVMVMGLTLLTCVLCLSWGWVSPACCAGHDVLVMEMGLALLTCVLCWSLGWASPYSPVCCAGHGDGSLLTHLCVVLVMRMGLALLTFVVCWSWGWVFPCFSPVCCAGHGDGSRLAHLCVVLVMMLGLVTGTGLRFVSMPLDHRLLLVPLIFVGYSSLFLFSVSGTGRRNFCWFVCCCFLRGWGLIQ